MATELTLDQMKQFVRDHFEDFVNKRNAGVIRKNIGGGFNQVQPHGTALSPPITGFRGMSVDGIGWGTGITLENVWVSSFSGTIGVHDFQGRPVAKESDIPVAGKLAN